MRLCELWEELKTHPLCVYSNTIVLPRKEIPTACLRGQTLGSKVVTLRQLNDCSLSKNVYPL